MVGLDQVALASLPGCTVGTLTAKAISSGAQILPCGPHSFSWVPPTSGSLLQLPPAPWTPSHLQKPFQWPRCVGRRWPLPQALGLSRVSGLTPAQPPACNCCPGAGQ